MTQSATIYLIICFCFVALAPPPIDPPNSTLWTAHWTNQVYSGTCVQPVMKSYINYIDLDIENDRCCLNTWLFNACKMSIDDVAILYRSLSALYSFVSVVVESRGALGEEASNFFRNHGHRITSVTTEPRSVQFLLAAATECQLGWTSAI